MRSWGLGKGRKEGRLDNSVEDLCQDRLRASVSSMTTFASYYGNRTGTALSTFPVVGRSRQAAASPASSPRPGPLV